MIVDGKPCFVGLFSSDSNTMYRFEETARWMDRAEARELMKSTHSGVGSTLLYRAMLFQSPNLGFLTPCMLVKSYIPKDGYLKSLISIRFFANYYNTNFNEIVNVDLDIFDRRGEPKISIKKLQIFNVNDPELRRHTFPKIGVYHDELSFTKQEWPNTIFMDRRKILSLRNFCDGDDALFRFRIVFNNGQRYLDQFPNGM